MEVPTKPTADVGVEEAILCDRGHDRYERVTIMMSIRHPQGGQLRLFKNWRVEEQSQAIKQFMEICNETDL